MNSAIITLILVLVTVGLGIGVFGYYSSLTGTTYNSVLPLQTAMELSKELQISYSPPVISYVVPTEKGQPLNISVDTLLTLNLNFSGTVYLIPFLMKSSYSPYYYIPSPLFGNGFINEISNPNYVGYVSISGQKVETIELTNAQINLLTGSVANINAYAFKVTPGEELNVTFTTNYSYVPVIWVVVNLYGNLYRIAYPVIESQLFINTYSGSASSVIVTTYGQLYQKLFGSYSLLFETGPASTVTFNGNDQITTYGAIGYNDGGNGQLIFNGNDQVEASGLYYNPGTIVTPIGHPSLPPCFPSNDIPYVPVQSLINPLYCAFSPYQYQLQLEKEANEIYNQYTSQFVTNPTMSISVSKPVVITQPTIFTNPVTFSTAAGPGPYNITFDAPVIFEGPVTDLGVDLTFKSLVIFMNTFSLPSSAHATFDSVAVFEGDVGITNNFEAVFKEGALFNSSDPLATITFSATQTSIISDGPLIMNLTDLSSSINFIGNTYIYNGNSVISLTANSILFKGNTNIQSNYPVFIQTTSTTTTYGKVTFGDNSDTVVSGGLVINSVNANVVFSGTMTLDIPNGDLLINAGSVITSSTLFKGNSEITVGGPIAIQSYSITLEGTSNIQASGYLILDGQQISFNGNNNDITLNQGVPNNVENQQIVKYVIPVGLNPSPLYIAGWFSVVPNNSTSSIITTTLLNTTYQVTLNLVTIPKSNSPTEYNLLLYVNSTQYELTTINAYQQYMYVIEGYVLQGKTYLEVTILSPSTQLVSETIQVPLPLDTGIQLSLGSEPNYQLLIYSGNSNIWQTIYNNGPYVESTQYLQQEASGINYLQYYYLISPTTSYTFQLTPTYYISSIGPLMITVEGNSLS
ncbi:hypothetical protein [Sulfurisphaera ohwakuensis]|uniref:hypothetical protein n=1 Tax=Sulfurisphaera ohwakuensis TaxID=69656 RepID=UPI0036F43576